MRPDDVVGNRPVIHRDAPLTRLADLAAHRVDMSPYRMLRYAEPRRQIDAPAVGDVRLGRKVMAQQIVADEDLQLTPCQIILDRSVFSPCTVMRPLFNTLARSVE